MISDEQIINGCKNGKREAFNLLYKKYAALMLGVCMRYTPNRMEAEDVLQEGFIRVFRHIKTFEGRGSFEGWIRRIMVNAAINHYKANRKHQVYEPIEENEKAMAELNNEAISQVYEGEFSKEELLQMISELPDGYRMVFNLYVFEEMPHKEIAAIMDFTESTSKSQLSKARKWLRTRIKEKQKQYSKHERVSKY
jgi:RNA polymerase sigma-70 factor (ECF subfamily)